MPITNEVCTAKVLDKSTHIPYETAHIFVSNMMPNIIRSFNERILNKGYTPDEIKIRKEILEVDLARVYYAHELSMRGYQKQMPTIEIKFNKGET